LDSLQEQKFQTPKKKFRTILIIISSFVLINILNILRIISTETNLPNLYTSKKEGAVRGKIISKDNFHIASSYKLYNASINTKSLEPDKRELFCTLVSIYINIDKDIIKRRINKRKGNILLAKKLSVKDAENLRNLSYKLRKLKVFRPIKTKYGLILRTIDIQESSENREYIYNDTFAPIIGYIRKDNKNLKVNGIKGIEKFFNYELNNIENGLHKGERDVISRIIFNGDSIIKHKFDGFNIHLTMPVKLQKNIEIILDKIKDKVGAEEIVASVMDSRTGNIMALATSNRFNPNRITQQDVDESKLDATSVEREYEPGSIMKPLIFSMLFEEKLLELDETVPNYNGRYRIDKYTIKDSHRIKNLNTIRAIAESSNVAASYFVQRLSGKVLIKYLLKFGFAQKTGVELPYEKNGSIRTLKEYMSGESSHKDNIYKATTSYGYGMTVTFMQMMQAYNVINNQGFLVKPTIINYLSKGKKIIYQKREKPIRIISNRSAKKVKYLLEKTIDTGTGKKAKVAGIFMGGKTGTAHISTRKGYGRAYISSFFGFANSNNKKYMFIIK